MFAKGNPTTAVQKRKPFVDLTNISSDDDEPLKSDDKYNKVDMMPVISNEQTLNVEAADDSRFQNVHPLLGWYKQT